MVKTKLKQDWERLDTWYQESARGVLEQWDAPRVPSLDNTRQRLGKLSDLLESEFKVCILGKAGVGKSTLLNALIDQKLAVLPQGGVGPLTAQAIVVRHADDAYFEVTYHGRRKLNQLLFALQQAALGVEHADASILKEIAAELDAEALDELRFDAQPSPDGDGSERSKTDSFLQQGRLIVQGSQFATTEDIRYIVDGLRACLDLAPVYGSTMTGEDMERVAIVRAVLPPKGTKRAPVQLVKKRFTRASSTFLRDLKLHAAGALAPLVSELHVGWPAPILSSGATLVDLPGVGIANDDYQRVTRFHVKDSRAIGIVVDRAGIDAASAELLRDTGFLNALLLESGDEQVEPIHLFVAVVKLDMTADDRVNEAINDGIELDWLESFATARTEAIQMLKGQLGCELSKLADDAGDTTRADMRRVVERLLESVEVFPVAAMEYRKFFMKNGSRLDSPEQSHIPQLGGAIAAAAEKRRVRIAEAFARDLHNFKASIESSIAVLREQVRRDDRAAAEIRALQEEFARFSEPLGKELAARKGAFRTFLRETVPSEIEKSVLSATEEVRKDIQRHLRKYRAYPWQTLRATIRRGGAFVGARNVDLPTELTLKFEEPIALLWSKSILAMIRRRTREFGDDNIRIAEQVVKWTKEQGGRVPRGVAEVLETDLRTDSNQLATVGKDALDELKEKVKHALFEVSQARIRRSCQSFVTSNLDVGRGVKDRMHEFFEGKLADALLEAARPAALKVLKDSYIEVQNEVLAAMRTLVDPVDRARELVVDRQAASILQKDRAQRARLDDALAQLQIPDVA